MSLFQILLVSVSVSGSLMFGLTAWYRMSGTKERRIREEPDRKLAGPRFQARILLNGIFSGGLAFGLPLAFEAKEPNVMRRPPRAPDAPIFGRVVIVRTVLAASLMAAGAIGLFIWEYFHVLESGLSDPVALADAQTMAVTTVVAFQVFYLLNSRSLDHSLLEIGLFSNWTVWAGIGALAALQLGFIYLPFMNTIFGTVPLPVPDLLLAIAVGVTILPVISAEKWIRTRLASRRATATTRPA